MIIEKILSENLNFSITRNDINDTIKIEDKYRRTLYIDDNTELKELVEVLSNILEGKFN